MKIKTNLFSLILLSWIFALMNDFNFKWIFGKDLPWWLDILCGWIFNGAQAVAWVLGLILQSVNFSLPLFK